MSRRLREARQMLNELTVNVERLEAIVKARQTGEGGEPSAAQNPTTDSLLLFYMLQEIGRLKEEIRQPLTGKRSWPIAVSLISVIIAFIAGLLIASIFAQM